MIVSITGLIGTGKDTAADFLCNTYNFKKFSFASALKDAISSIFNWDRYLLEGSTPESRVWREQKDSWWSERLGMNITPRWVLQYWGTEVCRNQFHQDIWVASLENKLRKIDSDVVITDCRFPNEIDTIRRLNGMTLRIERGPKPEWYDAAISYNQGPNNIGWALARQTLENYNIHPSEYSSVGLDYDYIVENNGTIKELNKKIKSIVNL